MARPPYRSNTHSRWNNYVFREPYYLTRRVSYVVPIDFATQGAAPVINAVANISIGLRSSDIAAKTAAAVPSSRLGLRSADIAAKTAAAVPSSSLGLRTFGQLADKTVAASVSSSVAVRSPAQGSKTVDGIA